MMVKKLVLIASVFLVIAVLGFASAFSFSDFFANIFGGITGKAVENGQVCGSYSLVAPINSSASDSIGGSDSAKAHDGSTNTAWQGNNSLPFPKWIYFDLGTEKCINSVQPYFQSLSTPITMNVQISSDMQTWTDAATGWEVNDSDAYVSKSFSETTGRYVRLYQTAGKPEKVGTVSEILINASSINSENSQVQTGCVDSDNGINNFAAGFVNESNSTSSLVYKDVCAENFLTEYYCKNGKRDANITSCENGCQNAMCLTQINEVKQTSTNDNSKSPEGERTAPSCGTYQMETPFNAVSSSQFNNYRATNAIDGDINTHWYGDPGKDYPKWIYFDLGAEKCINSVDLDLFVWDAPVVMDIQVSNDARTWNSIIQGWEVKEGGKYETKQFSEVVARYVRIVELDGKRNYGTVSEVKFNAAPFSESAVEKIKLVEKNTVGTAAPEKFYEIDGRRVYVEIDGKSVEDYFK